MNIAKSKIRAVQGLAQELEKEIQQIKTKNFASTAYLKRSSNSVDQVIRSLNAALIYEEVQNKYEAEEGIV